MSGGGGQMQKVELVCAGCDQPFVKALKEVTRQRKRQGDGVSFFCSLRCHATASGKHNLGSDLGKGRQTNLIADNQRDEFSPFRWYMARLRSRQTTKEVRVTLADLKSIWEHQGGQCPLSGLMMELPATTQAHDTGRLNPWKASLDRIDHHQGYVPGNIRFVVCMANLCRNGYTDDDVRSFCHAVVQHSRRLH